MTTTTIRVSETKRGDCQNAAYIQKKRVGRSTAAIKLQLNASPALLGAQFETKRTAPRKRSRNVLATRPPCAGAKRRGSPARAVNARAVGRCNPGTLRVISRQPPVRDGFVRTRRMAPISGPCVEESSRPDVTLKA